MQKPALTITGQQIISKPSHGQQHVAEKDTVHVEGVAGGVYFAYEQLRNAADYTQRHLLLRSSIERFLRRSVYLRRPEIDQLAEDLVIELTQARYIANDTVAKSTVREIKQVITEYCKLFDKLEADYKVPYNKASTWIYQIMATLIERLINPTLVNADFVDIAHSHYLDAIDGAQFGGINPEDFEVGLYCAIHRVLLKSDQATARTYWIIGHPETNLIHECQKIDAYFDHPLTNKLGRLVNHYGAPMRTIRQLFWVQPTETKIIGNRPEFIKKAESAIFQLYEQIGKVTISSLWRMVAFVFITKMVIGLAIEIPYNLATDGYLPILPMIINLAFPPLYMMSVIFSLNRPGATNTSTVLSYIERIIYKSDKPIKYRPAKARTRTKLLPLFNIIYAVLFLVPLFGAIWILAKIGFNWLDGVVFFVFLSAVGYLRFRLLQASREMDITDRPQTLLSTLGDFFHLPFATLGRWLSDRYQRLNVITYLLDVAIELPLKTILRTLQQWVSFMRDKRDMM